MCGCSTLCAIFVVDSVCVSVLLFQCVSLYCVGLCCFSVGVCVVGLVWEWVSVVSVWVSVLLV